MSTQFNQDQIKLKLKTISKTLKAINSNIVSVNSNVRILLAQFDFPHHRREYAVYLVTNEDSLELITQSSNLSYVFNFYSHKVDEAIQKKSHKTQPLT